MVQRTKIQASAPQRLFQYNTTLEFYLLSLQFMDDVLNHRTPQHSIIKKAKRLVLKHGANPAYVHPDDCSRVTDIDTNNTRYRGLIGRTALMNYVAAGCIGMVEFILQHGGALTLNARDWQLDGFLALSSMMKLEKKILADIDISDTGKFSNALSIAMVSHSFRNNRIVSLLLEYGADLSIFSDDEYYRPILFMELGELNNDASLLNVSADSRSIVISVLQAMGTNYLEAARYNRTIEMLKKLLLPPGLETHHAVYRPNHNNRESCSLM